MAQHFIQLGILEVSGERLQVVPVQRPKIYRDYRESRQPSTSASETAVPVSPVVEVSWSHGELTRDTLRKYLENQKRSGGGKVKDLQFFADKWKAYVRFVDAECKLVFRCNSVFLIFCYNLVSQF